MGYWEQNEEGHSFAGEDRKPEPLLWGDTPADIIDSALHGLTRAFLHDQGRPPSRTEVEAGLKFSLRGYLETLPATPEEALELSDAEFKIVEENYYVATGGDVSPIWSEPHRLEASKKIRAIEERVLLKPEEHGIIEPARSALALVEPIPLED